MYGEEAQSLAECVLDHSTDSLADESLQCGGFFSASSDSSYILEPHSQLTRAPRRDRSRQQRTVPLRDRVQ